MCPYVERSFYSRRDNIYLGWGVVIEIAELTRIVRRSYKFLALKLSIILLLQSLFRA